VVDVANKVAVVTGSSAGVGRATAERLAALGASVVVNFAHSQADAEEVVAGIREAGGTAHAKQADVGDDAQCRALIQDAVDTYGGLHILVNNAGATHFIDHANLEAITAQVWADIMSVNVEGPFNCTRAAAPHMREAGEGAVVNVSSVAGFGGGGSSIPYAASKSALIIMTKSLARVLGPEIRVNCIAPGFITGRWLEGGLGEEVYEAAKANLTANAPLRDVATPERCADAILAFIQHHTFSTGQTIVVDGGATL
jgi:3-oxoacyl-[acyl-carrier protein] reductase